MSEQTQALTIAGGPFGPSILLKPKAQALRQIREEGLQSWVQAEAIKLRAELVPPTIDQIALTVETLQAIYGGDKRDEASQRVMVNVWKAVLEDIPGSVLMAALEKQARVDTPFMPKPGEFRALCQSILSQREAIARRAEALAAGPDDGEIIDPPAEVSEEDRAEMSAKLRGLLGGLRS